MTQTKMQNAVDAASLAASQEINAAVYAAGQGQGSATIDANSIAVASAKTMAAQVAQANGVFVDPAKDVKFGKRVFNNGAWTVQWGATPYNVVQVAARRTESNVAAADGKFPLAFGWAVGKSSVPLQTTSSAFVEARDMVLVLDFSASMNDDSSLVSSLASSEVNAALDGMWDALRTADPKWPGTTTSKFPSTGFGTINSYAGTYVSSTNTTTILSTLGLTTNVSGHRKYPFPQSGRNSDGSPNAKPSNSTSDSLWTGYINYVKGLSGTYKQEVRLPHADGLLPRTAVCSRRVGRFVADAALPDPGFEGRHVAVLPVPDRPEFRRRSRLGRVRPIRRATEDVL